MEPSAVFLIIVIVSALYTIANFELVLTVLFHLIGLTFLTTTILFGIGIALLDTGYSLIEPIQDYLRFVGKLCGVIASYI